MPPQERPRMIGSLTGRLVVATPVLEDPNFERTVILVCSHDEAGAFGLVLNRPLGEPVAQHLPEWGPRAVEPPVFFAGGPVQRHIVMGIGRDRSLVDAGWWTRVTPDLGLIDLRFAPSNIGEREGVIEAARLFVGYAGWGAGQLESEIAEDAWWVVRAHTGDPFASRPERLWSDVLLRQRGRRTGHLALYANSPANARHN